MLVHVARSVSCITAEALQSRSFGPALNEQPRKMLEGFVAAAGDWEARAASELPFTALDPQTKRDFRGWWNGVTSAYQQSKEGLASSTFDFAYDVEKVIKYNVRLLATRDAEAFDNALPKYAERLIKQNQWTPPDPRYAQYRIFNLPLHQMLGYGKNVQQAHLEHRDDILLSQLHGDEAFMPWHDNTGCVLQIWINKAALMSRDFSAAVATLECD